MSEDRPAFHDLGILPVDLREPAAQIRASLTSGRVVAQFIVVWLTTAAVLAAAVFYYFTSPPVLNILGVVTTVAAIAAFLFMAMRRSNRWVELDGHQLRAQRLYTGQQVQHTVDDISSVVTIYLGAGRTELDVLNKLFGRVKGVEIQFKDGRTPLRIYRTDPAMTNAQEIVEAILFRMQETRELDVDATMEQDRLLVKSIQGKVEPPGEIATNKVTLGCLLIAAVFLGAVLAYLFQQQKEYLDVASKPPQQIKIDDLIKNGPGANRHVIVTDFNAGGFTVETKDDHWQSVWVALFPLGVQKEIEVVLGIKSVFNQNDLAALLAAGKVQGVCSAERISGWGATLGPNLIKANQDLPLKSAWKIDEMRRPPNASVVAAIWYSSVVTFAAALALAAALAWKSL